MQKYKDLTFTNIVEEDIEELTQVMKRAFDEDSKLSFNKEAGGPTGYDDGSFLRKWGIGSKCEAFTIRKENKIVGAVIIFIYKSGIEGKLGNIFIDPKYMGKGYASNTWEYIEKKYSFIKKWYTETPAVSFRNHCFYINKLGFNVYAVEGKDKYDAQFLLVKDIKC